jgi:ADP-ribosylglycohydrolase
MLGVVIGDLVGSPFEFLGIEVKDFEPFIRPIPRFTDDMICTVAIADSLLSGLHPAEALRHWFQKYEGVGRWGQRFALWFSADELEPTYRSYGNGAAMRISQVGFLASNEAEVIA